MLKLHVVVLISVLLFVTWTSGHSLYPRSAECDDDLTTPALTTPECSPTTTTPALTSPECSPTTTTTPTTTTPTTPECSPTTTPTTTPKCSPTTTPTTTPKCSPTTTPTTPKCPDANEEYRLCGSLSQETCLTKGQDCTKVGTKCKSGCYCKKGFIRPCNEVAKCEPDNICQLIKCAAPTTTTPTETIPTKTFPTTIATTTTPKCPENEQFIKCGSFCQDTCATIGQKCTRMGIQCENRCYCKSGYVRDCSESGRCIPIRMCHKRRCAPLEEDSSSDSKSKSKSHSNSKSRSHSKPKSKPHSKAKPKSHSKAKCD